MTLIDYVPSSVQRVLHLDLRSVEWRWPFAAELRGDIDAHFTRLRENKPQLWNGRVLLAREPSFSEGTLRASCFETDFASFLAWRDWGFPDRTVFNVFGMGALRGSDGAFVLGEMAAHTANAGRVYFPSGTPEPSDCHGGRVDLAASVAREVTEETGLTPVDYLAEPHWSAVVSRQSIALIRILQVDQPAEVLCSRIARYIATEVQSELAGTHIVRGVQDVTPAMPGFVAAFIAAQGG